MCMISINKTQIDPKPTKKDITYSAVAIRQGTVGKYQQNSKMPLIFIVGRVYWEKEGKDMILFMQPEMEEKTKNLLWFNIKIILLISWLKNKDKQWIYSGNGIIKFLKKLLINTQRQIKIEKVGKINFKIFDLQNSFFENIFIILK